ncbi:MAG TPA: hypothetical protein VFH78_10940 [Candidatus Thermoplasmatota archaeon]|nr:hypothetical protein [Candidatus Thermoplasmatota archaeon]
MSRSSASRALRRVGLALAALLLVPATVLGATTSITITNAAPTVTSAALPSTSVSPTAGGVTNVTATLVITDLNGCNDLASVVAEVRTPGGAVHTASSAASYVSCSAGTAATYRYVFPMRFHDAPAALETGYQLRVTATDKQGATGTNLVSPLVFAYAELAAIQLDRSTFNFGASVAPAAQSDILALAVQNAGNVQVDTQLAATALAHASEDASIPVSALRYSLASNMSDATAMGSSSTTLSSFDLGAGAASSRSLYWRLAVPSGDAQWVPSGTYTGTVTVSAVKG